MISERSFEVLRAIVQDYVSTKEPVGSKALLERHGFGVSSATIRNDMSILEEEGLIHAPHTSAGRVPTDSGYRLFVDRLNELKQLSTPEKHAMETLLESSVDLDEILGRSVRLLSQLTNQVAIVQYPTLGATRVRHIELVALGNRRALCIVITDNGRIEQRLLDLDTDLSEADLSELRSTINAQVAGKLLTELAESVISLSTSVSPHLSSATNHIASALSDSIQANRQQKLVMAGTANLVRTEEDFHGSIYPVLDAIEEQVILLKLLTEMKADAHEVAVSIGREHSNSGLEQTSLLATGYTSAGESATLGLLGPTRMDYSNNIASIRAVARYLTRVLDAQ